MSLLQGVKERFQTPKRPRALLRERGALSLGGFITTNLDMILSACFELFIAKLTDIQTSLSKKYRNDTFLRNKWLNAGPEVDDVILGIISLLSQSSVSTPIFMHCSLLQQIREVLRHRRHRRMMSRMHT